VPKAFSKQLVLNIHLIPNYRSKLYGSRRILDYKAINNSDYDFYFHISELEALGTSLFELKHSKQLIETSDYISSKPKYGKVFLLLRIKTNYYNELADILIFTDKRDVTIMDKVLNTLEHSNADQLLMNKSLRISVYNYMLQLEGFTPKSEDNKCMDINTEQVYNLIMKSHYKIPIKRTKISPFSWFTETKTEDQISNTNKEQSWLKKIITKLI